MELVDTIIDAKGVWKRYDAGKHKIEALRGLDLMVGRGEVVAIMGPSGCGKTTLLNCLSGLDVIDEGTIKIAGRDLKDLTDNQRTDFRAREMGFVFQTYNLLPVLTGIENVELPMLVGGVKPSEARKRAQEAIEMVGVGEWAPSARGDERRAAPAFHDRACAVDQARHRLGRRAHRRPRHGNQRRDHGPDGPAQPPERADLRVGHARRGGRGSRATPDSNARRPDRLGLHARCHGRSGDAARWIACARGCCHREGGLTSFFGIPPITLAGWMAAAVAVVLVGLLLFAAVNRVLLKMALRNIPRRRAQTVLILFGLMLATLIITASLSVGDTLSFSLQAIQLRQIGGIDEAFTRHQALGYVQGASTADTEFFSDAQAADVVSRSKKDSNVAAAVGVIAASGSMIDTTTSQSSSENVAVFGVPADFRSVWGTLRSRSGGNLDVATLAPNEVYVGDQLGTTLNARAGDRLDLYIDGHLTSVTVRGVLDTEVNPSIANHGPIVNSVLMPLDAMRGVMQRP